MGTLEIIGGSIVGWELIKWLWRRRKGKRKAKSAQ